MSAECAHCGDCMSACVMSLMNFSPSWTSPGGWKSSRLAAPVPSLGSTKLSWPSMPACASVKKLLTLYVLSKYLVSVPRKMKAPGKSV